MVMVAFSSCLQFNLFQILASNTLSLICVNQTLQKKQRNRQHYATSQLSPTVDFQLLCSASAKAQFMFKTTIKNVR